MKALRNSTAAMVLGLVGALACLPAAAQSIDDEPRWHLEFTPYFWAAGVRGDVNVGRLGTQQIDIASSDILSALDFGAMGSFEARKGPWGGLVDAQYVKISTSAPSTIGVFGEVGSKYEQQIWTFAGFYRVAESPVTVDVLGGARYIHAKAELSVPNATLLQSSEGWWDGLVGARLLYPLNPHWSLVGWLDVGGGGSKLSWQAIAGVNYRYSSSTTVKFGYRHFSFERDGVPVAKASLSGVYVGVGFRF